MIDPHLNGKTALITGANHGIGAATAQALAAQGMKVFITYYRPPSAHTPDELEATRAEGVGGARLYEAMQQQGVERVLDRIRDGGGIASASEADLADPTNIPRLFDRCEAELGAVDLLVNNHTHCVMETFDPARVAGEGILGIGLIDADGIDAHFAINTRAYALMMREYVTRYLARDAEWGRIINLSTDAAHAHDANVSYAASKHAIESYSRSAAAELGRYGITVNVVAPGPVQTGYISPAQEQDIALNTPLGRVGRPQDVADIIVMLASEQARWLTGQLLYVGGGWRMGQ
jgi:3-oxoacyl-[acyl-carrier protein] reductase